ncbi:MAG: pilus (MSHA type) biogenesis protein MshL [Gammaproteobacteria bacterium]|nr:MAG: pilus (MSHA type) biogenesis protein MshL [Gammaproteobacteria bacterium]
MEPAKQILLKTLLVISVSSLAACSTLPTQWSKDTHQTINNNLQAAQEPVKESVSVPKEVADSLLPPLSLNIQRGTVETVEPAFDLTLSRASARKVYMGLVEDTMYSVVIHPDVKGKVSLDLKNVTVPEAMDVLRDVYGYHYRRDGNRFYILARGMQTRIFPVNYLNLSRKGRSRTRVVSGELTQNPVSQSTSNTSGIGKTTRSNVQSNASMQIDTESKVDFWKDLAATLETIIGDKAGRSVVVNPQAGIAIVRAMPRELIVVERFLGITHDTVNRQVVLEAKIVEVELSDRFQMGVNWSQLGNINDIGLTGSQIGGGSIFSGSGFSEIFQNSFTLDPASGLFDVAGTTGTSAFGGVFSLAVRSANFSAFIEALKGQGDVHVLSSPRVSTVNNQKAVIKVGGDEFFVTGVSQNVVTSGTSTILVPTVELTPFFSGIALDVTPQIDEKNNVIMHIHPSVSSVVQRNKSFVISGDDFNLPLAMSSIQESDNVVRARSGQVVVIGGLMKEGSSDESASIPLLGDIPILGNLFKHKRVARIKKELIILLRPTVIDTNQQWKDAIDQSRQRLGKLQRSIK